MKNGKFDVGTLIKGKDLKGYILCKVLSEDMVMQDFQYKMGLNEDVNPLATEGSCEAGLHFCLIKDVCRYLDYGNKLALISIPDDEDVYVDYNKFRTHRLYVNKIMKLDEVHTWEYLIGNGADITVEDNFAVRHMAEYGHLEVVKYLHIHGADITADNNQAIKSAAWYGHLDVVKYLHKNNVDLSAYRYDMVISAKINGNLDIAEYLTENV